MWSLPDITELNNRAASKELKSKIEAQLNSPENYECDFCGKKKATSATEWFDIFSMDAKGVVLLCEDCEDSCGSQPEGYFYCGGCDRLMIENYTWEMYLTHTEDGDTLCLVCALDEHINERDNWIDPAAVKSVVLDQETPFFDQETGVLNISKCRHVISVEMPVPDTIHCVTNVEFDSHSGSQISGGDPTDIMERLASKGIDRVMPILDAAYQFAVSIGFYIHSSDVDKLEREEVSETNAAVA